QMSLNAVHGIADDDLWAVGAEGTMIRWNGTAWTNVQTPVNVNLWDVWQAPSRRVFVVGNNGTALSYDPDEGSWEQYVTGVDGNLYAIHGTDEQNVWAVGNRGLVLHYTGGDITDPDTDDDTDE